MGTCTMIHWGLLASDMAGSCDGLCRGRVQRRSTAHAVPGEWLQLPAEGCRRPPTLGAALLLLPTQAAASSLQPASVHC